MAVWQCRHPMCAWHGPWYACCWDGFLHLCCPRCGDVCDPILETGGGVSALDRLLLRWGGLLFVLLSVLGLWHVWDDLWKGDLDSLARLGVGLGLLGYGLLALGGHEPPHTDQR